MEMNANELILYKPSRFPGLFVEQVFWVFPENNMWLDFFQQQKHTIVPPIYCVLKLF